MEKAHTVRFLLLLLFYHYFNDVQNLSPIVMGILTKDHSTF